MPRIILVRHAETNDNREGIFTGQKDVEISINGRLEARKLAEELEEYKISCCFSSTLIRAKETARILFPNSKIILDSLLIERSLGEWEGMSKKELSIEFKSSFLNSGKLSPLYNPPYAESIDSVIIRVNTFLKKLNTFSSNETIAIVTHNGIIRAIRSVVENQDILETFNETEPNLLPRLYSI